MTAWQRSEVTPVRKPLITKLHSLVLDFGWKTCKIFSSKSGGCAGRQHRVVLGRMAGQRVERAVREAPERPGKTGQGQLGFLSAIMARG